MSDCDTLPNTHCNEYIIENVHVYNTSNIAEDSSITLTLGKFQKRIKIFGYLHKSFLGGLPAMLAIEVAKFKEEVLDTVHKI